MSFDDRNVCFYVRTRGALTDHGDRNWMLLFIDCDGDGGNHWPGYDFVANRGLVNGQSTTLKAYARGGGTNGVRR